MIFIKKIAEKTKNWRRAFGAKMSHWKGLCQRNNRCKLIEKLKSFSSLVFSKMTHRVNLRRDIVIVSVFVVFVSIILASNAYVFPAIVKKGEEFLVNNREKRNMLSEEQIYEEVRLVQEGINSDGWKSHRSQWYGFELKYPENWAKPVSKAGTREAKWEYIYQFRKANIEENNPYLGFDLKVYNLNQNKNFFETEEFSLLNKDVPNEDCQNIDGHIIETGDYPAEEIYIQPNDACYSPTLFFSFTKGEYIYSIMPVLKDALSEAADPRIEVVDNFPEFFTVASTLNPIDIVRPRIVPKPRITAPMPVAFKRVGGRLVCDKKDDNPGKSNQNKKKHLDRECCLDPDEYPNPHCYYDPKKYGKYL